MLWYHEFIRANKECKWVKERLHRELVRTSAFHPRRFGSPPRDLRLEQGSSPVYTLEGHPAHSLSYLYETKINLKRSWFVQHALFETYLVNSLLAASFFRTAIASRQKEPVSFHDLGTSFKYFGEKPGLSRKELRKVAKRFFSSYNGANADLLPQITSTGLFTSASVLLQYAWWASKTQNKTTAKNQTQALL